MQSTMAPRSVPPETVHALADTASKPVIMLHTWQNDCWHQDECAGASQDEILE
jgi:hypothetical protein